MDVLLWLFSRLAAFGITLTGLFMLGKRFQRLLLPFLLLLLFVPFYGHVERFSGVKSWTGTHEAHILVEEATQRLEWTSYLLAGTFYIAALLLTWRTPFLAPMLPFLLLGLYQNVSYNPFADAVQSPVARIWLDDNGHNLALFLGNLLVSICLLAYTLPSLLKLMKDHDNRIAARG